MKLPEKTFYNLLKRTNKSDCKIDSDNIALFLINKI